MIYVYLYISLQESVSLTGGAIAFRIMNGTKCYTSEVEPPDSDEPENRFNLPDARWPDDG